MVLDNGAERFFLPKSNYDLAFMVTLWVGITIWGAYRAIEIAMLGSSFASWDGWALICAGFLFLSTVAAILDLRLTRLNRLTLSPSGVVLRRGRKTFSLAWSDVETAKRVEIRPIEGENYWAIALSPKAQAGHRPKDISLDGFEVDPDELLALIQGLILQHARVQAPAESQGGALEGSPHLAH